MKGRPALLSWSSVMIKGARAAAARLNGTSQKLSQSPSQSRKKTIPRIVVMRLPEAKG